MLRGAQKQMIVVRTRDSRLFEEAYFVVRRGQSDRHTDKQDMLWEANRIIERSLAATASPDLPTFAQPQNAINAQTSPFFRRKHLARVLWFLLGCLCGSAVVGLLWFFL